MNSIHPCIHEGRIIRITLGPNGIDKGPRGGDKRGRPAVIITSADDADKTGQVVILGGSTQGQRNPAIEVNLPRPPRGRSHPLTKLDEDTYIVCDWPVTISIDDIKEYAGTVPGKHFTQILEIYNAWKLAEKNKQSPPECEPETSA